MLVKSEGSQRTKILRNNDEWWSHEFGAHKEAVNYICIEKKKKKKEVLDSVQIILEATYENHDFLSQE